MPASKRKRRYAATMEPEIFLSISILEDSYSKKFDLKFEQICWEELFLTWKFLWKQKSWYRGCWLNFKISSHIYCKQKQKMTTTDGRTRCMQNESLVLIFECDFKPGMTPMWLRGNRNKIDCHSSKWPPPLKTQTQLLVKAAKSKNALSIWSHSHNLTKS